jgi:hypothetical protein
VAAVRPQRQTTCWVKGSELEGAAMFPGIKYRQPVLKAEPSSDSQAGRRRPLRESLDTLILGALSTSIGVVLMIVLVTGIARRPIPGWSDRAFSPSASYYVPSRDCAIAAVAGEAAGLAGILLARHRHGTISPLSILGTVMSLLHVYMFFLHVAIMEFS